MLGGLEVVRKNGGGEVFLYTNRCTNIDTNEIDWVTKCFKEGRAKLNQLL